MIEKNCSACISALVDVYRQWQPTTASKRVWNGQELTWRFIPEGGKPSLTRDKDEPQPKGKIRPLLDRDFTFLPRNRQSEAFGNSKKDNWQIFHIARGSCSILKEVIDYLRVLFQVLDGSAPFDSVDREYSTAVFNITAEMIPLP